jgi:selenide,water dikinase
MFPSKQLDMGLLREILRGGHDKTVEAGACLVGGHTVDDEEPKYGLCVNGTVHPDRIITNAGAQPGDTLILTKPIGSGVLFNATRSRKLPYVDLERDILPLLAALNGPAIDAALQFNLHACTDVTGFGILGHLLEVAHGCDAKIVVKYQNLPFFPYALDMYRKGESTGSNKANRVMVNKHNLEIRTTLDKAQEEMLYDPQTSGGLLLSLPNSEADALLEILHNTGVNEAVKIGEVVDEPVGIAVV